MRARVGCLAVVLALFFGPADAELLTYPIDMKGTNEVPPNDSPGTGHADVAFDTTTRVLTWRVIYSNLTGPVTGMHFHGSTPPGQNAGIVLPFRGNLESPVTGSAVLTEAQANDLTSGKWYINAHTSKHPGGELRGQVNR